MMRESPNEISVRLTLTQREIVAIRKLGGDLSRKINSAIHEAAMPSIVALRGGYVVREARRVYGRVEGPDAYVRALDLFNQVRRWLDQMPEESKS